MGAEEMALVKYLAVSDEPDGSAAADQRGAPVPGGRSQRLSPAAGAPAGPHIGAA